MIVDSYNLANFDTVLLTANLASNVPGNGIYDFAISKYSLIVTLTGIEEKCNNSLIAICSKT